MEFLVLPQSTNKTNNGLLPDNIPSTQTSLRSEAVSTAMATLTGFSNIGTVNEFRTPSPSINTPFSSSASTPSNNRFCYRHRPDISCHSAQSRSDARALTELQTELLPLPSPDAQAISDVWKLFSTSTSRNRNLILRGLLTQCCFPQLSIISASVRELIKIDFLSFLPGELSLRILCHLDTTGLCRAAQVSKKWKELAEDDFLWLRMCEQHIDRRCSRCGWGLPLLERKRLEREKADVKARAFHTQVKQETQVSNENTVAERGKKRKVEGESNQDIVTKKRCIEGGSYTSSVTSTAEKTLRRPWKHVYRDRFIIGTNWKYGRCETRTIKVNHPYVHTYHFDDTRIGVCANDNKVVEIWDVKTGQMLRKLIIDHVVFCIYIKDNKLMAGDDRGVITVWNLTTGERIRTLDAHEDAVVCLQFDSNFVVSGSADGTIRVYDLRPETKSTFLLRGHLNWVNDVRIDPDSRTVLSAGDDNTVRLWDLEARICILTCNAQLVSSPLKTAVFLPREFELDDDCDEYIDHIPNDIKDVDTPNTLQSTTNYSPTIEASQDQSLQSRETVDSSLTDHSRVPGLVQKHFWPDQPSRASPPRFVITGGDDNNIRLWELTCPKLPIMNGDTIATLKCRRTLRGHDDGIRCLVADHLRIVSGSFDGTIKVWDPHTSKCERTWVAEPRRDQSEYRYYASHLGLSDTKLIYSFDSPEVNIMTFGNEEE